ncbi:hypothetical protein CV684_05575 [Borreliella burgdorferi]|uniref:exported protein A EppA n=1 Tax=Borreliella burgdorferi TaxID=139 RepID=UPI000D0450DE|nr:exported protein A EppA [Borreliella burgdorferi]PRQ94725.1 hypothetical protein CV684_05575 [Borreliella burgdorferi]
MKKIWLFLFLIFNLNAYIDIDKLRKERKEHNFAKAKKTFSKEDFDLLNKRLDNYDFENEYDKSVFFAYAPIIRGRLRKIGIKEKSVFLDAIDVIGYLIKYKSIVHSSITDALTFDQLHIITNLIDNNLGSISFLTIFYFLAKLNSDKVNFAEKYGKENVNVKNFKEDYAENNINAVKQILIQFVTDLETIKN